MKNEMRTSTYNASFFSLIIFSLITGFVTLALFAKTLPLVATKTLYFCQQLITNTLLEIPKSLPNTIIFVLIVGLTLGVLSFLVQLWKTRKLVKGLLISQIKISGKVRNSIVHLGLNDKVYLIKDQNLYSFCFGIFFPRIIITTGLVKALSNEELKAVLLHERAHVQGHDPFKILLGKTIASIFFFLPIFSELNNNMNATNEILADRSVMNVQKDAFYLKSALKKILMKSEARFATVAAISNPDHLEVRIRRLINPTTGYNLNVSLKSILTSLAFLGLSWFFLQTPVNAIQTEPNMNASAEPSYFLCSTDNVCWQQCHHNAQTTTISTPEELFSR